MNPQIQLPRPNGGPSNFGSTPSTRRNEIRMPRFFKRLFKFPQMDFEMAIWEIMSLIIAPKKVFRQIYYHGLAAAGEHALRLRAHLLLHHHLPRLQRAAVFAPHRAATRPSRDSDDTVVRIAVWIQYGEALCAGHMGGRQATKAGWLSYDTSHSSSKHASRWNSMPGIF
ncbi:hypothetical protein OPT61_g7860 [Boeremia exigua]|uniref:Uncharacterized protein n=1 Tax=Boeremia exigua TaxID=749465 RepID=A0ACC2I0U5_9PLEO|nr:hypothetical protein OPT61_g7860 [Boeremia exigua]